MAVTRVLDLSESIAGAYCARLLSATGADVVIGEAPGGHPLRTWSCAGPGTVDDGALFSYLHGGHRAVGVDGADQAAALAAAADVVIVDAMTAPLRADPDLLTDADRTLVVTAITPYGRRGPYAGRAGSELTVQADSGALAVRGHPARPPFQAGGNSTEWLSGAYAAAGTLALLRRVTAGGAGGVVDVSWAEVASVSCTLFADVADALSGRPAPVRTARSLETPSIEPTADGYVGFNTNTAQMFSDFLVLIERPDLLADPEWSLMRTRFERWDEWNDIVHAWTARHTTAEIVEAAALLRIPAAPVNDAPGVLATDQFVERGVFVDDSHSGAKVPRRPWRFAAEEAPPPAPPPGRPGPTAEPGPSGGTAEPWAATPRARTAGGRVADDHAAGPLPCAGLTVVDLTSWWAGAAASAFLGALGADVIHVESTGHVDGMRMIGGLFADRPDWWELSSFFLAVDTNKRGLTLDLAQPEGRELLLRLIETADVVMENFTPRVLERFDLGWDVVHAANPSAVMVRMPAFGLTGPWRDRPGFAQTMEQVTGLAHLTGYADDQPRIQRGPSDPNAGLHAAVATLAALSRRDRTGEGLLVEVPMVEAALAVAAESVIEWTAYGRLLGRMGNRSPRACPQGLYACAGTEQWLALSVPGDEQWSALVEALGKPDWAAADDLATFAGRRAAEDELDGHLARWAATQTVDDALAILVPAGVPAAAAWDPRTISRHPQFQARGFYETVDHPTAGPIGVPTLPLRLSGIDRWTVRPAPTVGQHNTEILTHLGLSAEQIDRLETAGVIGTRPRGL